MELGAFSVSLTVKDIEASRDFYTKLGFVVIGGDLSENWLILQNGAATIGLFQGMFDKNILTFNPGWSADARKLDAFTDIRSIQRQIKGKGITLISEANETTNGPDSFFLEDPDGNPILFDQHV
ncbi:MAG: VOC family protein [Chloroflexota bacterium]|nr:VOC family protein [Chloroflexota bacterium]